MKHGYVVSMTCMSCHEIGMQWKTNGRLWVRDGANHYAGRDCGGSGCHSPRDKLAVRPRATVTRNVSTTTKPATGLTPRTDRKSTRLNSSHSPISYAVFCL